MSSETPSPVPPQVAVLLPCHNEELTISKVIADFRAALPDATIYVFDNCSTDATAQVAAAAGATVVESPRLGKGNVVQHMFRAVDADLYVMADGDDTYPAAAAPSLIRALEEANAAMVVGTRLQEHGAGAFRILHKLGNKVISSLISLLFATRITDALSGYRILRRDLVRRMHLKSTGFEIETEMTLQAALRNARILEIPVPYASRPPGSVSKLNTFTDGSHILKLILLIFKDYKPIVFFSILASICFLLGLVAGWYPVSDYIETRYVSHVPLALLAAALELLAALFWGIGLVLGAITRFHFESRDAVDEVRWMLADKNDPR